MNLLIVDEQAEMISAILTSLKKGGGSHEVHTASSFATARKAAEKMQQLDVLIAPDLCSNGDSGYELSQHLRARFPELHVAFTSDAEPVDAAWRSTSDPVFSRPPEETGLLEWTSRIGFSVIAPPSSPAAGPRADQAGPVRAAATRELQQARPVVIEEDDSNGEDDVPMAETLAAPGKQLGDYKLLRLIGGDGQTETHEALQVSIDRPVALVLLKPEFAADNESVREFRGLVRARAKVSHPTIAPVYEGYEEAGALFYTRELIEGASVRETIAAGQHADDEKVVKTVKVTAEAMSYLDSSGINHDLLEPKHIYLGADGQIRIANLAVLEPRPLPPVAEQIRALGEGFRPLLPEGSAGVAAHLLATMCSTETPPDWASLQAAAARAEDGMAGSATYNIKSSPTGAGRARWWIIGGAVTAAAVCLIFIATLNKVSPPKQRELTEMARIAGGEFIYQNGETDTLPTFWIDTYEVSIGQYAEFLDALGLPHSTEFDHQDQPGDKLGHQPEIWDDLIDAAKRGVRYEGDLVDLNCPMVQVDWWDAYAYAKWKGRRLPTEREWEKAGRGKQGLLYPWGNEASAEKLAPEEDGYSTWRPVDATPGDLSELGVMGLAGNVREWTGTWEEHPELFGVQVPVLRGGSFRDDSDSLPNLTIRKIVNDPGDHAADIGFRTVSDTDPALTPGP